MPDCQRLKTLVVLCEQSIQEVGEVTIPLPAGVTLDPITGQLNVKPTLTVMGDPILNDAVLNGEIINYGWVHAVLSITGIAVPISAHYAIPLQGHISCPDAVAGDHVQHFPTLLGTLVYGTPTLDPVTGAPTGGNLHLKVVYLVRIVAAREELVNVAVCPAN
ncbi:MAG: hypothetical protein GXX09_09840 [Syntrophomonadaceae bacterium]|nr:hypothetical protein [Syntrophomonadaceae bacterium]